MQVHKISKVVEAFAQPFGLLHVRVAIGALLVASIFLGCAQTEVVSRKDHVGAKSLQMPSRILVYNFEVPPSNVSLDTSAGKKMSRGSTSQTEQARRIGEAAADALSRKLVDQIRKLGMPAERAYGSPLPQERDLVIDGQFLTIDEGHRMARFVIGFGVGASKVKTQVYVYQIDRGGRRLIKQFQTVAKGSKKPGIATPLAVGGVTGNVARGAAIGGGVGVASEVMGGVESDAARTAKEISKDLADIFIQQGWIPAHRR